MDHWNRGLSRRRFLQVSAGVTGALAVGGLGTAGRVLAQSPAPYTGPKGTFNWLTWSDHYAPAQLEEIFAKSGIQASPSLLADNAEGFTKLKEVGGQLDLISGDALWVPKYYSDGLIDAWDINEVPVAQTLYSIARSFPIWTVPAGYLGYPFGWSPVQIYYDPAHVSPTPDSWEVLLDPKYAGRVVMENQPVEVMAYMGKLAGAK